MSFLPVSGSPLSLYFLNRASLSFDQYGMNDFRTPHGIYLLALAMTSFAEALVVFTPRWYAIDTFSDAFRKLRPVCFPEIPARFLHRRGRWYVQVIVIMLGLCWLFGKCSLITSACRWWGLMFIIAREKANVWRVACLPAVLMEGTVLFWVVQ